MKIIAYLYPGAAGVRVTLRRRWFPWFTSSFAFGKTVWTDGNIPAQNLRHELQHVAQMMWTGKWVFLWRYITEPSFRRMVEAAAELAEVDDYPKWVLDG